MNDELKNSIKNLPVNPGVYLMKNAEGQIIYIGKAKSLKNRVKQYFSSSKKPIKVETMVSHIHSFDIIITNSNLEALILENNLIKKHKPQYNILLKDDKTYPYIRIDLNEYFPTIRMTRGIKLDGAKYFGPYMQGINVRDTMDLIYSVFNIRQNQKNLKKLPKNHRACINYDMKRCLAPCIGKCTNDEYMKVVYDVIDFLSGDDKRARNLIQEKMKRASSELDFETALIFKKKLDVLNNIKRYQTVDLVDGLNQDIFAILSDGDTKVVSILFIRSGQLIGKDNFILEDYEKELGESLQDFMISFYDGNRSLPTNIVLNQKITDQEEFIQYMKEKLNVAPKIIYPKRGVKRNLLDMANANAEDYLKKVKTRQDTIFEKSIGAINALRQLLNLSRYPNRIECYDISHISGTNKIASMVVCENGVMNKKEYRYFKIKTVEGNDDFASMKEVITRRFRSLKEGDDGFQNMPDLLLIDGGFGQLKYAKEALEECCIYDVDIISIAERFDYICMLDSNEYIKIDKNNIALKLLQNIRDEAHRFAITHHRRIRQKAMVESDLLKINGIGPKKQEALIKSFKTLYNIRNASFEELKNITILNDTDVNNIISYFKEPHYQK